MQEKCKQEVRPSRCIARVVVRSVRVLALALLLFILVASVLAELGSSSEVRSTKMMVILIRSDIVAFKEITGRYPHSLDEIVQYAKEHPESRLRSEMYKEYLSDPAGTSSVHSTLNNKGGWYYNPATGQVKVNLTRPVLDYVSFYIGSEKDEIPSDW